MSERSTSELRPTPGPVVLHAEYSSNSLQTTKQTKNNKNMIYSWRKWTWYLAPAGVLCWNCSGLIQNRPTHVQCWARESEWVATVQCHINKTAASYIKCPTFWPKPSLVSQTSHKTVASSPHFGLTWRLYLILLKILQICILTSTSNPVWLFGFFTNFTFYPGVMDGCNSAKM